MAQLGSASLKAQLDAELDAFHAGRPTKAPAARSRPAQASPPRRRAPQRNAPPPAETGVKEPATNEAGVALAQWRCDLCGVIATGADPLRAHITGKRHQQMAMRYPDKAEASLAACPLPETEEEEAMAAAAAAPPQPPAKFQKGDRIEALWPSGATGGGGTFEGGWFKGRIETCNNDGSFVIAWDDGSTSEDFRETEVSPMRHLEGLLTLHRLPVDYTDAEVSSLLRIWRIAEHAMVQEVDKAAGGADWAIAEVKYDIMPLARAAMRRLDGRSTRPGHLPIIAQARAVGDPAGPSPATDAIPGSSGAGRYAPY
eukprot:TRINITY_DN10097_c0_g1_i2.p2 TRINITY_DN10097_c0_g1~~TRINITY_DN10097_c0_g1_i2.p2  ORF type:complete len:313 (+),score=87.85 TRINITY_DN10097_c0_g1_i2:99-1037(+)